MKLPFFKENEQYIPTVSQKDVERILVRDYSENNHDKIRKLIINSNQTPRIIVACFKNSGASFEALEKEIEAAALDYRDVLVGAEYSNYADGTYNKEISIKEKNQLINKDKEQYLEWFK